MEGETGDGRSGDFSRERGERGVCGLDIGSGILTGDNIIGDNIIGDEDGELLITLFWPNLRGTGRKGEEDPEPGVDTILSVLSGESDCRC